MKLLNGALHLKINVKSIVEQKMALAAYGLDGSIPVLGACQLDITNKVINVLIPTENITKSISADNALISVIIPLVRALHKTLKHDRDIGVRGRKRTILISLEERFAKIEVVGELSLLLSCATTSYLEMIFCTTN